jgi:antitoxin CptB
MATRVASGGRKALEVFRRKLGFRAWRRGTSEADLLIGTFADQYLAEFAGEELRQFERLLEETTRTLMTGSMAANLFPANTTTRS